MMKFIDDLLSEFRVCFSRKATFEWFVVIVAGLLLRTDYLGVTSFIRGLYLSPNYMALIGFFRSSGWTLEDLTAQWCAIVVKYAPIVKQGSAVVIAGDGIKKSKEGRRMPGVKRLHQESENSSKAEYIWGHMFGGVGILAEKSEKCFCIPLAMRLQDGVKAIFGWGNQENQDERQCSHVVEMVRLAHSTAKSVGKAILLLDRLFLTVPALQALDEANANDVILSIVTKAKSNCVAYCLPEEREKKRGRPRKKGKSVKVICLFSSNAEQFATAEVCLYGKMEQVRYYSVDLLWGQKLYKKLRFVLVEFGGMQSVLASTDLTLEPCAIIELYGRRFSIETMFREMQQVVHALGYRFWSKCMPKRGRFRKKSDVEPLEDITSERAQKRIRLAVKATEGFVFCATVAIGILQIISLHFSGTEELRSTRYLRTYRNTIASEATVADFLHKSFFRLLANSPSLAITRIISAKQSPSGDDFDFPSAA